jgi:hypothetical protein
VVCCRGGERKLGETAQGGTLYFDFYSSTVIYLKRNYFIYFMKYHCVFQITDAAQIGEIRNGRKVESEKLEASGYVHS